MCFGYFLIIMDGYKPLSEKLAQKKGNISATLT